MESILANYNYTLDDKGRLAFIGKKGESLKADSPKFKEMQQVRRLYDDTFTNYIAKQKTRNGYISYEDAEQANKAARAIVYIKYPKLAGAGTN